MKRERRLEIAQETVNIVKAGRYQAPSGQTIHLKQDIDHCLEHTIHDHPKDLESIWSQLSPPDPVQNTVIEIVAETTLEAAERLILHEQEHGVAALNFASAKNPGGGFLKGSQAQEESLARASALYESLTQHMDMYEYNRGLRNCLYSDHMIFSKDVPVFRNDDGSLREQPYNLTMLTSPAVNAGIVRKRQPKNRPLIHSVMTHRTELLLAMARHRQQQVLILGAWGCGVFRNDPQVIANIFFEALIHNALFKGAFKRVVFAIPGFSKSSQNLSVFEKTFSQIST